MRSSRKRRKPCKFELVSLNKAHSKSIALSDDESDSMSSAACGESCHLQWRQVLINQAALFEEIRLLHLRLDALERVPSPDSSHSVSAFPRDQGSPRSSHISWELDPNQESQLETASWVDRHGTRSIMEETQAPPPKLSITAMIDKTIEDGYWDTYDT